MDSSYPLAPSPETPLNTFALSPWQKLISKLRGAPLFPLLILVALVLTAASADLLAPHDPTIGNLRKGYRPPTWQEGGERTFLLGTDHMGRDILSRIMYGSRISLIVATAAVVVAGIIGTILGILSGFRGGWVDQVVMRLTESSRTLPIVQLSWPPCSLAW